MGWPGALGPHRTALRLRGPVACINVTTDVQGSTNLMAAILAIEADRNRRALLTTLIREHVQADVTIVDSVKAALEVFAQREPDVIVAPALLSPRDSEQLASHVKQHASPHVQMLTIPALDLLREPPAQRGGLGLFGWRRPVTLGLQYDPGMVGKLIADRLERALTMRAEGRTFSEPSRVIRPDLSLAVGSTRKTPSAAARVLPKDRRVARRTPQQDAAWLWSIRLPWATDVTLVNISRTGLLLESASKVSPGVILELRLTGENLNRVVAARFIRSAVARVDRLGVRYHAAAQFEEPLDIPGSRTEPTARPASLLLAELLTGVLSGSNQPEAPSIRFARGLRTLLGVRDVLIRRAPLTPVDGTDSIFFHVSQDSESPTILQVMFDRNHLPTAEHFRMLKAASGLAAAVLELERLPSRKAELVRGNKYDVA
jgi:CheY-like chemotaxis protein